MRLSLSEDGANNSEKAFHEYQQLARATARAKHGKPFVGKSGHAQCDSPLFAVEALVNFL